MTSETVSGAKVPTIEEMRTAIEAEIEREEREAAARERNGLFDD